jgi:hypothetical protein
MVRIKVLSRPFPHFSRFFLSKMSIVLRETALDWVLIRVSSLILLILLKYKLDVFIG